MWHLPLRTNNTARKVPRTYWYLLRRGFACGSNVPPYSPYAMEGFGEAGCPHPGGPRPPPNSSSSDAGGATPPPHRKKKGDWRAYSPPNLPHPPYLRKVRSLLFCCCFFALR